MVTLALIVSAYLSVRQEAPRLADFPQISAEVPSAKVTATTAAAFPAVELHSALTDVCSNTATGINGKEWTQEEIQAQIDAFNTRKRTLTENLSASASAEHLHLAARLADDSATRFELLSSAVARSPSDPFLIWGAIQICSEELKTMPCPLREWERQLIAVDGQNSESWIRIAANRYASGDNEAALQAMRHASTGAESRAYWPEMIEMIERGLAASSDLGFPERAEMAFVIAASELPRYGDYVTMCEERSAENVDWGNACLAYGQLVENQGKTEMGVAIGRWIQKSALETLGEVGKAAEVERRIDVHHQESLDSVRNYNPATEQLVFSSPTLFSAYLSTIRIVGEEAARKKFVIEIERLIQQRPDLSCEQ